jgi:phosphatidylglycerol:prolipoprotein diacylglycerol transferase
MAVSGMFLLFYGLFRFAVELVRLPDAHLGYLAFGWVTMGQILTVPMLAAGLLLLWLAHRGGGTAPARSGGA